MADFCVVMFLLLVVIGLVISFGHGVWVLIATASRAIFDSTANAPSKPDTCAGCGRSLPSEGRKCIACGMDRLSPMAEELADLIAAGRQLERFRQSGAISPALWEQVYDLVRDRQRFLRAYRKEEPEPAPTPAAATSIPVAPVPLATRAVEIPLIPSSSKQSAPSVVPVLEEVLDVLPVVEPAEPVAAVVVPVAPPPAMPEPVPPPPPRRSLGELLSAFMEERNILWGELIGGLLIVGCSIALVISLWQTLEQIPYFPFLILSGITAALFGAGLYTLHHWKLESTSRGLLVIGTLLVPLNFMVLAGLVRGSDVSGFIEVGVTAASLGLFSYLLLQAGRVLLRGQGVLLPIAVLGTAATQLLIPWLLAKHQPVLGPILFLGSLAVLCQGTTSALALRRISREEPIESPHLSSLFALLGMGTFSLAVALGFLVYWNEDFLRAFQRLAVIVAAGSIAPLICGAWTYRRLTNQPDLATARTAGTVIALGAALFMLLAVGLAWPRPLALAVVCGLNFAVLTGVAFRCRMPVVHAVALPCLMLGYLTTWHALGGRLSEESSWMLANELFSARSGTALAAMVVVLGIAAEWLARIGRRQQAACYAAGAGITALLSLALVSIRAADHPIYPLAIYTLYGAGSLALNFRWRKPAANYLGLGLLIGATLWGLQWRAPGGSILWGMTLALEALALAAWSVIVPFRQRPSEEATSWSAVLAVACRDTAAAVTALAVFLSVTLVEFPGPGLQAGTAAILAGAVLMLAWAYQREWLTGLASFLLFVSLFHAFAWDVVDRSIARSLILALLTHASLVLFVSLALHAARILRPFPTPPEISDRVYRFLTMPLRWSALVASAVVVPLLLGPEPGHMVAFASYVAWLAAFWLVVALVARTPALFSAFQLALNVAVIYAVTAWLEGQPWLAADHTVGLADPRSLHAFGIALAALGLLWTMLRISLPADSSAWHMLEPGWPAVDQVTLVALVVGQLVLAICGAVPGIAQELIPAGWQFLSPFSTWHLYVFGTGAWVLLAILAVTLLLALRGHASGAALLGLATLAVTIPVLQAGRFEDQLATASAVRWGMAACFLAMAVPVWFRSGLARVAAKVGIREEPHWNMPLLVRGLLVILCVVPVLCLTADIAVLGFAGLQPTGPAEGSFFFRIGWVASNVWPLMFLSVALVGHALRERSPGYAFSAGLLLNISVMGGYALNVVLGGGRLDEMQVVRILQFGSLVAAVWALFWLTSRRWLNTWREGPLGTPLMLVQVGMAAVGNAVLLGGAIGSLVGDFHLPADGVIGTAYPLIAPWASEAGTLLGWLALALTGGAFVLRGGTNKEGSAKSGALGGVGLVLIAILAASMTRWFSPTAGYRTLMLGTAIYALSLALLGATRASIAEWVRFAGLLAVVLGIKAAIWHQDQLGAAAAIAIASAAGAVAAVGRRREEWAFTAGLGFNLAASFLVWHFQQGVPLDVWWVYLVQANCAANGAGALLWLAARKRLYGDLELKLSGSPLLATQNLLGLLANLGMFGLAFLMIFVAPTALPRFVDEVGEAGGWLALLLPMAAALWYAARASLRQRFSLVGIYGLMLGILAGCTVNIYDTTREWWAYQALTVSWIALGMACLGIGLVAVAFSVASPMPSEEKAPFSSRLNLLFDSVPHVHRWVEIIGLLVVILALRESPWRSYQAGAATAAVSVMAMGLALVSRRQRHVYQFGLLIDLACLFAWFKLGPHTGIGFLAVNVLGFSLASAFWSALESALEANADIPRLRGRVTPFNYLAIFLSLSGLCLIVSLGIVSELTEVSLDASGWLPWTALIVTALAVLATLWDSTVRWTGAALYAVGLLAIGLAFSGQNLSPQRFGWLLALALVGYVGLTSALAYVLPRLSTWRERLRIPHVPERDEPAWLASAQVAVSSVAVLLSVWIVLTFEHLGQRLAGPLAIAALLPAGVLLAGRFTETRAAGLRQATLALFALVLAEFGWTWLGSDHSAMLLHRTVILMMALAVTTLIYSGKLGRLPEAWAESARRLGPILGIGAALQLVGVLVQEGMIYNPRTKEAAVAPWAIAVVALGLIGLVAAGVRYAVMPGKDPLGLSERGRMTYVYAGEILLVILLAHLRLTMPYLFTGLLAPYYSLIVMALAFVGVGLAELFHRRGVRVLAEPLERTGLFLPVLPLLAFWLRPGPDTHHQLPALQPLFDSLARLPTTYDHYARLWFLAAGVYALMGFLRRSVSHALVAALAANFGLWAMLHHQGWQFLAHPQLWLIPLALIFLVAEHLNRDRLTPQQSTGLRYLALGTLYLSSTAEMFITGLSTHWWVPLPLMLLAVAGMLVGILLCVRAYLFLGAGFLFLVIFSMIWNAAVDRHHTWVWWASGIVLGGAILALFAVFEKRRNDVLRVIDQIKGWT